MGEAAMGAKLDDLRFVVAPKHWKLIGTRVNRDLRVRFFMDKIKGNEAVVPTGIDNLITFGKEISGKAAQVAKRGVVLGDLKPANLIYDTDMQEHRLIDFGTSLRTGDIITSASVEYASPEVWDRDPDTSPGLDDRHDVYCLASMLAEPLLGQTPNAYYSNINLLTIPSEARQQTYREICDLLRKRCGNNVRLAEILGEALNPEKTTRPHMQELHKMLQEITPEFKTFRRVNEDAFDLEKIDEIASEEEIGAYMRDSLKAMEYNQEGQKIRNPGKYFENTNYNLVGKLAKELEDPSELGNIRAERMANYLQRLRETLKDSQELTPAVFLNPGEPFRSMTSRERDAITYVVTINNLARRLPLGKDTITAANFTHGCLKILRDRDSVESSYALLGSEWANTYSKVISGFDNPDKYRVGSSQHNP